MEDRVMRDHAQYIVVIIVLAVIWLLVYPGPVPVPIF
jgi:hypothetical protein